jgi:DNA-binding MarR family transcriptional regulator
VEVDVDVDVDQDDEYVAIGRQFGRFFRNGERLYQSMRLEIPGRHLDRAAYHVLARIAGGGPVRLSEVAGELCVDLSTVSRQVATLEADGLIRRTPDPSDRRASLIEATDAGTTVFTRHRKIWLAALQALLADWTPTERREFASLFARLNDSIAARTPGDNR